MLVSSFDFDLPKDKIASFPADPPESAKLLSVHGSGELTDFLIADFPSLLRPSDLLVFNDTRVIPARLFGTRGEAKLEATLFKAIAVNTWGVRDDGAVGFAPSAPFNCMAHLSINF